MSGKEIPRQFMRRWCSEHGIDLTALLAATRSRKRRDLAVALKERFPTLTSTQVGLLLGLHHTSVLYAWQLSGIHSGVKRPPASNKETERFRALSARGFTMAEIARQTGRSATFVHRCLDPVYSERHARRRKEREKLREERRNEVRREAMAALRRSRMI